VLLACLGLAGVSLAATGGSTQDPGAAVVSAAKAHLHDTYMWGATGPRSWDCSGLISTLWHQVGGAKDIPRTSRQQQAWAVPLPAQQVLPGDLVFFGDPVTHVGIVERRDTTSAGTTVQMVDASASRHGVVERQVWTTGTVRFGRVPRKGMTPVTPWTPPTPTAGPSTTPATAVQPRTTTPAVTGRTPLFGLARTQQAPSSAVARRAVALARGFLGNTTVNDVELIRTIWRKAGGAALPTTREALGSTARPVAVRDARVGDLVLYAAPAGHVGIYVGNGLMVDASRSLGKVVLRQVWASPAVGIFRLSR